MSFWSKLLNELHRPRSPLEYVEWLQTQIATKREIIEVLGTYGYSPEDLEEIYLEALESYCGVRASRMIVENPEYLAEYLQMKASGVTAKEIAWHFMRRFQLLDGTRIKVDRFW